MVDTCTDDKSTTRPNEHCSETSIDIESDKTGTVGHLNNDCVAATTNNNSNNSNSCPNISSKEQASEAQFATQEDFEALNHLLGKGLLTLVIVAFSTTVLLFWYDIGIVYLLLAIIFVVVACLLIKPGWRWFYIAAVTLKRDNTGLWSYIKLLLFIKKCERKNLNISDIFESVLAKKPNKVVLISETQQWTALQLNEYSNKIANVFYNHGYKKGDVVALLLENSPEFVGIWLGLSKIGVIVPLINTNLRGQPLLHSIKAGQCMALIFGKSNAEAVLDISTELPTHLALYQIGIDNKNASTLEFAKNLDELLESAAKEKVAAMACNRPSHHDKLIYIYTSGTTGLPKAAVISHSRYFFIAAGIHHTLHFNKKDIFYIPLPLYHTAGGVMGVGQALLFGSTVVIRKKFTSSGYFADCKKYNCTVAQYIGEMTRYILATKPSDADRKHSVRMIFGNGLRPQIWSQFVERFNIQKVGEFYGATEGNANIVNNDNTVGAIGFVSRILPQIYPISLIRANETTGEPLRNRKGFCELCKPNETGVFIGKIIKNNPARQFLGYVDAADSSKKVIHDVFKKGDAAFYSGDLLVSDERGYLYFKDRTGDTFRWRGENVSTTEVEALVSNVAGYKDTVVYGVLVPHNEGRAGMAAIHNPECDIDLKTFAKSLSQILPSYAVPRFLRFLTKIDLTGTYKLRKLELQNQGFDPTIINDDLFYMTENGEYEKLTAEIFQKISNNEFRF